MKKYTMPDMAEHNPDCIEKCLICLLKRGVKDDEEVHLFAEKHGLEPDKIEEMIYDIAGKSLRGLCFKGADTPDMDFDKAALLDGTEHELEHTDDMEVAKAIAKGHLLEDMEYYDKLAKLEK